MKLFKKKDDISIVTNDEAVIKEQMRIMGELEKVDPSSDYYQDLLKSAQILNDMRLNGVKVLNTKNKDLMDTLSRVGVDVTKLVVTTGVWYFAFRNILEFETTGVVKSKLSSSMVMKMLKL